MRARLLLAHRLGPLVVRVRVGFRRHLALASHVLLLDRYLTFHRVQGAGGKTVEAKTQGAKRRNGVKDDHSGHAK